MPDSGLPPEVEAFLDAHIFSVTQLEVLLLAREAGGDGTTAERLSRLAHVPERSLTPWLEAFVERGLLALRPDGCYGPADLDDETGVTVQAVADAYAKRRVTLSRYVYATAGDPARRFADAFRFRKDKEKDR